MRPAGSPSCKTDDCQKELGLEIKEAERENENLKKLHLSAMSGKIYKVFGLVTNLLEHDNRDLVLSHHERCGKAEEIHLLFKEELAGGHMISKRFGANAAYWNIAVMAMSLNNILKRRFLPKAFHSARPKRLKYLFYGIAGRFVRHARRLTLRLYPEFHTKRYKFKSELGLFCNAFPTRYLHIVFTASSSAY